MALKLTLLTRYRMTVLCLVGLTLFPGWAGAQSPADLTMAQAGSMPPWTVPVLRLVSATHVEPTTGVVLSDSGMVLVPADFAGPGDEIIVLDGGTDIIRNGRPAKIIKRFTAEGLQVLSVPTLRRQGADFSAMPLEDGSEIRLSAFPPAELIAEGKPPVDIQSTISIPNENGKPHVSGDNPLPNVSGALVDSCGGLAGYSAANGVQSMSTTEFPRYQWKDTLIRLAGELDLTVREVECQASSDSLPAETQPPEPEPLAEPEPEAIPPETDEVDEPEPESSEEQDDPLEDDSGDLSPPEEEDQLLEELENLPPIEEQTSEETPPEMVTADPSTDPDHYVWLWLLGAMLLLGGGFLVHRLRNREEAVVENDQSTRLQPLPVTDEASEDEPLTPGLDSELLIFGEMTDGTSFEIKCPVSSHAINLLIGRGQADIAIESPAISRRHALLNGAAKALTLSDLGSSNGTTINGVPCLEGETMYVSPGDTIITGNARFHFRIVSVSQGQDSE